MASGSILLRRPNLYRDQTRLHPFFLPTLPGSEKDHAALTPGERLPSNLKYFPYLAASHGCRLTRTSDGGKAEFPMYLVRQVAGGLEWTYQSH
jgi:hypothetical protein